MLEPSSRLMNFEPPVRAKKGRYEMYKVKCYDDGWVTMCKLVRQADGELDWEYCKWDSREDAQREADAYKEAWGRNAYVVEA